MRTKTKTMISAAIAAIALAAGSASARSITSPAPDAGADTYGSCYIGGSSYHGSYRTGYRGGAYAGHYNSGHYSGHRPVSYTTRCRIVDRYYFMSGCYRYCRITYLHERVDCYGRVVSCWRSCKTVRA